MKNCPGLIVFPIVDKNIKEGKEDIYEVQVKNIESGAKQWATSNALNGFENNGDTVKLTLYQLKQAGMVDNNITDPKTKKLFPDDMIVTIKKTAGDYVATLDTNSGNPTALTKYSEATPTLKLNGDTIVYLEYKKNSTNTYNDPGVTAISYTGNPINSGITSAIKDSNDRIVLAISYGQIGTYTMYYDVTDSGITERIARTVIVRDSEPPVITVPATTTRVSRSSAASYNLISSITVTDESGYDVVADRTLPSTAGTYTITYTATDRSANRNVSTARRTIIVQ